MFGAAQECFGWVSVANDKAHLIFDDWKHQTNKQTKQNRLNALKHLPGPRSRCSPSLSRPIAGPTSSSSGWHWCMDCSSCLRRGLFSEPFPSGFSPFLALLARWPPSPPAGSVAGLSVIAGQRLRSLDGNLHVGTRMPVCGGRRWQDLGWSTSTYAYAHAHTRTNFKLTHAHTLHTWASAEPENPGSKYRKSTPKPTGGGGDTTRRRGKTRPQAMWFAEND